MGSVGLLLYHALVALFSFFVVAPYLLNTISLFGVQRRFVKAMVAEGIVSAEDVRRLHTIKQVFGVAISVLLIVALVMFCLRLQAAGIVIVTIPLLLGFWKFRKVTQFNSLVAKRFQSTYQGRFDIKKYNKYVDKHF